jgi:uncharacterized damage-inducible protein DinB
VYHYDMSLHESTLAGLKESGKQLGRSLEGVPEDAWNKKPLATTMSLREQVVHLCHAYTAVMEHLKNGSFDWSAPFTIPNINDEGLPGYLEIERQRAVDGLTQSAEPQDEMALDYIVIHDAYHVGQIAVLRHAIDPEFDSYSLYK